MLRRPNNLKTLLSITPRMFFIIPCLFAVNVYAENNRADYDLDNDGLIEINDLNDLDEIRNNFSGSSLYDSNLGCPEAGCNGYELTQNLDFDTNQDGIIDASDQFWNAGQGWEPIGWIVNSFEATFEGNNFSILNLFINRPNDDHIGLFGLISNSTIQNIGLSGPLGSITGKDLVGSLIGASYSNTVSNIANHIPITGSKTTGGIIGFLGDSNLLNSTNYASVTASSSEIGGLAGSAETNSLISSSLNYGTVTSQGSSVGGIAGKLSSSLIQLSSNHGGVNSTENKVGGVTGYAFEGTIEDTSNHASITAEGYNVGGIAGEASSSTLNKVYNTAEINSALGNCGGIAGEADIVDFNIVFNTGNVFTNANKSGGIVGEAYDTDILNAFNTGSVVSNLTEAGGISGHQNDSDIGNVFSTGFVSALTKSGGVVGEDINFTSPDNAYWAKDSSTQQTSSNTSPFYSYHGVTISQLRCPTEADASFANSGCVSEDGSQEGSDTPITLYKNWGLEHFEDNPIWDFGTPHQLPGLVINGIIYRDSDGDGLLDADDLLPFDYDNDGIPDANDSFPLISIGDLADNDQDGAPDSCDTACLGQGMTEDIDDDNDGVLDIHDLFPLISIGQLADNDQDGAPDSCNAACLDQGMTEDLDDDNDGIPDIEDAYPFISLGNRQDSDQDGIPDECDTLCRELGMTGEEQSPSSGGSLPNWLLLSIILIALQRRKNTKALLT